MSRVLSFYFTSIFSIVITTSYFAEGAYSLLQIGFRLWAPSKDSDEELEQQVEQEDLSSTEGSCAQQINEIPSLKIDFLSFSADGDQALGGCEDSVAVLWDLKKGIQLGTFNHGGQHITVAHCGETALTGSHDGSVKRWNLLASETEPEMLLDGDDEQVFGKEYSPQFSQDLTKVLKLRPRKMQLWDLVTLRLLEETTALGETFTAGAISSDARNIVTVEGSRDVTFKERSTGQTYKTNTTTAVYSIKLPSDENHVLIGTHIGFFLWDPKASEIPHRIIQNTVLTRSISIAPYTGQYFFIQNKKAILTNANKSERICIHELNQDVHFTAAGLCPKGKRAITAYEVLGENQYFIRFWDLKEGDRVRMRTFLLRELARDKSSIKMPGDGSVYMLIFSFLVGK